MSLLEEKIATNVRVKNILFATDFSDASEAALPYVAALSLRYGSEIHLAHVLPEVTLLRPGAPDPAVMGSIYEDAHSNAQEKMQRTADRLKGFPHKTHIRHGAIPAVVSELIREFEIDVLVAGTHGRTGLGKLVMGSVAEEILRQAVCPVLTVGPHVVGVARQNNHRREREVPLARIAPREILYATDFKQVSYGAVAFAASLAREFGARLALLHVIEDYGDHLHEHPGPIDITLRKLEDMVPPDAQLPHPPEAIAQYGVPAEAILQTAAERGSDLIVLGARPAEDRLGAATHLGTAVAHRVIVNATCPVLTVRG